MNSNVNFVFWGFDSDQSPDSRGNMSGVEELEQQAHHLVDRVIDNSIKRVISELHSGDESDLGRPVSAVRDYDSLLFRETEDHDIQDIHWMTIDQFTIEKGEAKINEFVKVSWLLLE